MPHRRYIAGIALIFLIAAGSLVLTKRPWVDEAWFSGPAIDRIAHGAFGTPLLDPRGSHLRLYNPNAELTGINHHTYWVLPLHLVQLALWGKLFGVSIFSMRIPSVLWGLTTLACIAVIVRKLFPDRRAAWLAAAVLALDFAFLDSAADVRMDMTCAALGFAALAAYLSFREDRLSLALVLSHCLAAAACITHPNGAFAAVALVATMAYLDHKRWREMNVVFVAAPYVVAIGLWYLYRFQSPAEFSAQFSANTAGRMDDLIAPWRGIWREITGRYLTHYWPLGSIAGKFKVVGLLLAFVSGLILLLVPELRASKGCRLLVCLTLLRFLLLSVAANAKFTYYMVHMVPYFAALIGVAAAYALSDRRRWVKGSAIAALSLYAIVQAAVLWHKAVVVNGYSKEFEPTVAYIRSIARPEDQIVGSSELGFGLGFFNPQLADDVWLGYWSHRRPSIVVVDRWYYREVMETAATRGFPVPDYFGKLLRADFTLLRDEDGYQVYRRKE